MADERAARRSLSAEMPVAVAARETIDARTAVLARELEAARTGKVEGVHQLRVAIRRLRTALTLFADALPRRSADALERELADLGRAVGPVRDLDVLAIAVGKRGRKLDGTLAPAVTTLVRHIRDHRASAHAVLASTLDAPRVRRMLVRLTALARHRSVDATPVGAVAASLVRPLVRELRRAGRKAEKTRSPDVLHKLRIRAKHLRYALETLEGLGGKATRDLAQRLADLQHVLGDQRDATNQRAWLLDEVPAFAGDAEALVALGAIAEGLRRRARRMARRAPRAWRKVDRPKRMTAMMDELNRAGRATRHAAHAKAA